MPPDKTDLKSSRTATRKSEIRRYLLNRDLIYIEEKTRNDRALLRSLSSLLYDDDSLVRWRAIEALGRASRVIAKDDMEKIRRQVRRILWLMNDESGGLCRNGPEAIGEIIFNIPPLIDEYGPILISFLNEEPFEAGSRRAIRRVAGLNPGIFMGAAAVIRDSLENGDPEIRAFSIGALEATRDSSARAIVEKLVGDNSKIEDYDFAAGELREFTVGQFASACLRRWNHAGS